jgi:hypothetical protein
MMKIAVKLAVWPFKNDQDDTKIVPFIFTPEHFNSLSEVLSPDLIDQCLKESGVITLRKRRLPLENHRFGASSTNLTLCYPVNVHLSHRVALCKQGRGWTQKSLNVFLNRLSNSGKTKHHHLLFVG